MKLFKKNFCKDGYFGVSINIPIYLGLFEKIIVLHVFQKFFPKKMKLQEIRQNGTITTSEFDCDVT